VPIIAGAGGALVAAVGAEKLGMNPTVAAWGTAAVGAAAALGTKGVIRQVATGVGAAGMCLGALQLFANAKAEAAKKHTEQKKRQAEGEPYVTRQELNDALARSVDQHKQANCDLLTALREEVRQIVDETKTEKPAAPQPQPPPQMGRVYRIYPRAAAGEEDSYLRNAYGEEYERNAVAEEERNAFADDERNAAGEEDSYLRNAYGEEYERNAVAEEERNGVADDERNATGDETAVG
jgi:hypothetical protein